MADTVEIPFNSPEYYSWASVDSSASWEIKKEQNWTYHKAYNWELNIRETLSIKENRIIKDAEKYFYSAFGVSDSGKAVYDITSNQFETLNVTDSITSSTEFFKDFDESLKLIDVISNHPQLPFKEQFKLFDTLLRPINGVASDLIFEDGSWDLEAMHDAMIKGKHAGYENFKPFVYGDYTYDSALFRVVLEATNADRAIVEQFKIVVDVPDINDRGSAEVIDKNYNLKVNFNRTFHTAPEVTITMRGGVEGVPIVPVVVSVTESYFEMYLMNSVTGEKTTGSIIWNAVGY